MIKHRQSGDPKKTFHGGGVITLKCPRCGLETSAHGTYRAVRCPNCEANGKDIWMLKHRYIQEKKADEIRNRVYEKSPQDEDYKPNKIEELWDEGKIKKNVTTTVRPLNGGPNLVIRGRTSKRAWQDWIVNINESWYRLNDIGAALKEVL